MMEVLENVKDEETVMSSVELTGNDLFEVQRAVQGLLESSTNLKGFYVRKILKNLGEICRER
jgi:hypothetical protein